MNTNILAELGHGGEWGGAGRAVRLADADDSLDCRADVGRAAVGADGGAVSAGGEDGGSDEAARGERTQGGTTDKLSPAQWAKVDAQRAKEALDKAAQKPDVRALSLAEMKRWHGSGPYRNKYFAGTMPWHRSLRDVNLCSGNLFKSFTDIQVAPCRGAGLALQRTYNSQDERPGPFGVGWTHCYDLRCPSLRVDARRRRTRPPTRRMTASTSLTEPTSSPQAQVPSGCRRAVLPPPYLFDETQSSYDAFLVSGPVVPLDDTETGMDGTVKHFVKIGDNWRACDYIQDRYGSRINLTYGASVGGTPVPVSQTLGYRRRIQACISVPFVVLLPSPPRVPCVPRD